MVIKFTTLTHSRLQWSETHEISSVQLRSLMAVREGVMVLGSIPRRVAKIITLSSQPVQLFVIEVMMAETIGGYKVQRYFLKSKFDFATAFDFLNYIICGSKRDMKALATWEWHFRKLGVPFAITKETLGFGDVIKLWKKDEVKYG